MLHRHQQLKCNSLGTDPRFVEPDMLLTNLIEEQVEFSLGVSNAVALFLNKDAPYWGIFVSKITS